MTERRFNVKFSLIMGTLGRTDEIARFLTSLQRQDHRDFELLIVDQNLDDRLVPLIESYADKFAVRRVLSEKGVSRARNVGLSLATGDVFAFPDDDCWYPDGLLAYVAKRLRQQATLDGLTGRFVDSEGHSEGRWLAETQLLNRYNLWRGAISFSIFLRSDIVRRVGGFDESLGVGAGTPWGAGEETDYLLRALSAGARIEYDRELVLRHPVKTSSFDQAARERQSRYEAGFGRVIRSAAYPPWYFPLVCARTIAGATLALCTGRTAQAQFKWLSVLSRVRGWRASS
jgi:glycosyltransferase involved in cell wall biosynthesis